VDALMAALAQDPDNAAARMDLSVIEQLHGNPEVGLAHQAAALHHTQVFRTASTMPKSIKLLALAAPIHMGGNTPVEFLVEHSAISVQTLYIGPDIPFPDPLPDHDIAFVVAPGDSDDSRAFLTEINRRLVHWPRPVLNAPDKIIMLERDRCETALSGIGGLTLPITKRCSREALTAIAQGELELYDILPHGRFPVVLRPVGAHAGRNLERLDSAGQIGAYLDICADDDDFFLSDFIDYRSEDGAYRKYRIVFVDGRPYPCHMAISDQWKVWYMNADMAGSEGKRAEEERFMTRFDSGFAHRHAAALSGMAQAFGLAYFGIDCAEDRAGNLVLFEADNALIVHDMDSPQVFPYKPAQMHRIFSGFAEMVTRKSFKRKTAPSMRSVG